MFVDNIILYVENPKKFTKIIRTKKKNSANSQLKINIHTNCIPLAKTTKRRKFYSQYNQKERFRNKCVTEKYTILYIEKYKKIAEGNFTRFE